MPLTSKEWDFVNDGTPLDKNPNYLCTISCTDQNIQIVANLPQEFSIDIGALYEEAFAQAVNNTGLVASFGPKLRALGLQLTTQALTAQIWQGSTELAFNLPLVFQVQSDEYRDVQLPLEQLYSLVLPGEAFANGLLTAPGPRLDAELLLKSVTEASKALLSKPLDAAKSATGKAAGANASNSKNQFSTGKSLEDPNRKTSDHTASSNSSQPVYNGTNSPLVGAIKNNISLQIGRYMYLESVVITNVGQNHYVQPVASGVMSRVDVNVGFKTFYVPTKKDIVRIFRNTVLRA